MLNMVIMAYSKGELSLSNNPLNFIRDFLAYVNKVGIYDEFDKDAQKMVTSQGVEALIKEAQRYMPDTLKPMAASLRMRDLTDDERDRAIADSEAGRIIDMRQEFQRRMAKNKGAVGLLEKLIEASETGNYEGLEVIMEDAKTLVEDKND